MSKDFNDFVENLDTSYLIEDMTDIIKSNSVDGKIDLLKLTQSLLIIETTSCLEILRQYHQWLHQEEK